MNQQKYASMTKEPTLCPHMSPSRPAGKIKVPTVNEKAAVGQLSLPGSVISNVLLIYVKGTRVWEKDA